MREEFMITRQGKQFVLFAGLLDAFHAMVEDFDDGPSAGAKPAIETNLEQIPVPNGDPTGEGMAIVTAAVGYKLDEKWVYGPFEGIGDASKENVNRAIAPHLIRMAETRAKARALRDAINVTAEILEDSQPDAEPSEALDGVQKGGAKDAKPDPQGKKSGKARKSQVDMLKTLATDWRGEEGPDRLEQRIGKPLSDLTRAEADEWIDKLTPEGRD